MDMKHILQNMDAAVRGEKPSTAAKDVNDMKTILESLQSVSECGMGMPSGPVPSMPEQDKVRMNVSLNAEGIDAIDDLIRLMGGKGNSHMEPDGDEMPMALPAPKDDHSDMAKLIALASDEHEEDMDEEWDNAPEEEYGSHDQMIHDLSGGINRKKKMYAKAQDGDNAMAVEAENDLEASLRESLKAELYKKYQSI